MFQSLEVFRIAHDMAVHAGKRQAIIAENVANADTPDFKARDIPDFQTLAASGDSATLKATRARHLHGVAGGEPDIADFNAAGQASLDGNTVSIETEMLKAVETKRQHDRALSIYRSALEVLHKTIAT